MLYTCLIKQHNIYKNKIAKTHFLQESIKPVLDYIKHGLHFVGQTENLQESWTILNKNFLKLAPGSRLEPVGPSHYRHRLSLDLQQKLHRIQHADYELYAMVTKRYQEMRNQFYSKN